MAQFSVKILPIAGSLLGENQQPDILRQRFCQAEAYDVDLTWERAVPTAGAGQVPEPCEASAARNPITFGESQREVIVDLRPARIGAVDIGH